MNFNTGKIVEYSRKIVYTTTLEVSTMSPSNRSTVLSLVLSTLLVSGSLRAQAPQAPLGPIPEAWTQAFKQVRFDPPPPSLTRNSHYWVSNEERQDLFREPILNKGGILIGLGTDQVYLFAGWARPEIVVPLDFDQAVVDLHAAYRVFFLASPTPEDLLRWFDTRKEKEALKLLEGSFSDDKERQAVMKAYTLGRKFIRNRLNRVKNSYGRINIPTFLTDQAQYDFIVNLIKTGRVFPVRGDLTQASTVRDVAQAAKVTGLPVRVLYLSNAEQYFDYLPDFVQNMMSLPFDGQSVVIRTLGMKTAWAPDGLYEYISQSGENFRLWLQSPRTKSVWKMTPFRTVDKKTGASVIDVPPPPPPPPKDEKPKKK